jgi:hypothetical protein
LVKKSIYLLLVGVLVALAGCRNVQEVEVDALAAGTSVVFDKRAGRFVSFKVDGEENFWLNSDLSADPRTGWVDYGGDKVWVLPQASWKKFLGRVWPPGNDLEGLPWGGDEFRGGETLIEPAGVRMTRLWYTVPGERGFTVETQLERVSESQRAPVHIWGVGQVKGGEFGLIGLGKGGVSEAMWFGSGRQGCRLVEDDKGNAVALVVRPGGVGGKVGTMGRWVAAVYKDRVLVRVLAHPREAGETYAERSSVQLFQTREYWELETLGPVKELKFGESMAMVETWVVWERPVGMGDEELAVWVDGKVRGIKQ